MSPEPQSKPVGRREFALALLVALVAAVFVLREAVLQPGSIVFGVDTATVQLPWSKALGRGEGSAPNEARNPSLADQGVVFYPAYRFAIDGWKRGGPPLWNPYICAGAPAVGNPQLGVLDPQVAVLALLERLGGAAWRDHGLTLLAGLRIAAALLGAYLLARRLGLSMGPAFVAGASFASSGFVALWLNFSLGHVAFLLPWILLALEGTRGRRPGLAAAASAFALALVILGGHPETAFYVGATSVLWAFAIFVEERRAGRFALAGLVLGLGLAAPSLVPFLEYLHLSGARLARALLGAPEPDWLALALLVVAVAVVVRFRSSRSIANESDSPSACGTFAWEQPVRWASVATLVLFLAAIALLLARLGLGVSTRLLWWPDAFGAPGRGGWRGDGHYIEQLSAWVPLATLALAIAAVFSPRAVFVGGMRRAALVSVVGLLALALALRLPGLADVYRYVPVVGMSATVRAASVSALFLGLLAAQALERSSRAARIAAALVVACFAGFALYSKPIELPRIALDADDELVHFDARPPAAASGGKVELEGWIDASVPLSGARVRVESLNADGSPIEGSRIDTPVDLGAKPWSDGRGVGAPNDAQFFRAPFLDVQYVAEGAWRFTLELLDERGAVLGSRVAALTAVERAPRATALSCVFVVGALLLLAFWPSGRGRVAFALALVALQGADFHRGQNPAVPRRECFPPTHTVAILARELGSARYLADPGVLPANTGMIDGLRCLDGYDSMDVASFDLLRPLLVKPGVHPLLGFHARGIDLDSPLFALFGVGMLALAAPLEHPDWEYVAGPAVGDREYAEVFLYRAKHPLPRAFCVGKSVPIEQVQADPKSFDPRREVFLAEGRTFTPPNPLTTFNVHERETTGDSSRYLVDLDGAGMFVVSEQHYPGWTVEVDGRAQDLHLVDGIFRGVELDPGEHEVVFRYRPTARRICIWSTASSAASNSTRANTRSCSATGRRIGRIAWPPRRSRRSSR
ncbi:MAG: YfhO family protein [Planctomycetes bacterium]|nr:YfhO family protein [Planctomycetota bacterium]